MRKSELFFNVVRLPVDFAMLLAAGLATYVLRTQILSYFRPVLFQFNLPILKYFYLVLVVSIIFLISYAISGLYSLREKPRILDEFSRILIASSAGIMTVIIYIFLSQALFNSRFLVLGGWFFAICFVFWGRLAVRYLQVLTQDHYAHKIAVIGASDAANHIAQEVSNSPQDGYRLVGHLKSVDLTQIKSLITDSSVDEVILADSGYDNKEVERLVNLCHEKHIIIRFVPSIYQITFANFEFDVFRGLPTIEIKRSALDGWGRIIKRIIDIAGSLVGLVVFSPILGVVALAVKWETEGPVFIKQLRVSGTNKFYLYKFRSMIENAEELKPFLAQYNERNDGPLFKMRNDPRLTRVGRFIRKYRLDELPQLANILAGDISLVGPRPHLPSEVDLYQEHHKKVLAIKAGATGLAQVSGSSDLKFDQEVALDGFYIDNWSLILDLKIILRTIVKGMKDHSAA